MKMVFRWNFDEYVILLTMRLFVLLISFLGRVAFQQKDDPSDRPVRIYEFVLFGCAELFLITEEVVNIWNIAPIFLWITAFWMAGVTLFFLTLLLFPPRFSSTRLFLLFFINVGPVS